MANLKSLIVNGDSSLGGALYVNNKITTNNIECNIIQSGDGFKTTTGGYYIEDYNDNYLLTAGGGVIEKSSFLTSIKDLIIGVKSDSSLKLTYNGKTSYALVFSGSLVCSDGDYLINSGSIGYTIKSLEIKGVDTKTTAGATNTTSKMFLVGAGTQDASIQTYTNSSCFMSGGYLYSGGSKCLTSVNFTAGDISYYSVDADNNRNNPDKHRALTYISVNGSTATTRSTDCVRALFAEYHIANTGGVVAPNYFGTYRAGFVMQKTTVQNTPSGGTIGDSGSYKNYMLVDAYGGADVGGVTGFAIARQAPKAWIMQTTGGNKASWNAYAELITSYNMPAYIKGGTGISITCNTTANTSTTGQCTISANVYQLNVHGDLRDTATTPATYQGVFKFEGIKTAAVAKISSYEDASSFVSVYGMLGYSDFSGPATYEFATGNNGFYMRKSNNSSTWESWKKVITNKNTADTELCGIGAIYNRSGSSGDNVFGSSLSDTWGINANGNAVFKSISINGIIDGGSVGNIKKSSYDSAFTIEFDSSVRIDYSLTLSGNINCFGSAYAAAFYQSSDSRLKDIIDEISLDNSYKLIDNIQEIYFKYKSDITNTQRLGVIAQEVEEYFPELVTTDETGYKAVDYSKLSVICMKVIKDLKQRIEKLEKMN